MQTSQTATSADHRRLQENDDKPSDRLQLGFDDGILRCQQESGLDRGGSHVSTLLTCSCLAIRVFIACPLSALIGPVPAHVRLLPAIQPILTAVTILRHLHHHLVGPLTPASLQVFRTSHGPRSFLSLDRCDRAGHCFYFLDICFPIFI